MEKANNVVMMTDEQKAQFEAFQEEQARKAARERKRQQREDLQTLTDEVMRDAVAELQNCSKMLFDCKCTVMDSFRSLIELRKEVNSEAGKREQDSFLFTNSDGDLRIRIGYNILDAYTDSVEEGIAKVKSYIGSLAKDAESRVLVDTILRLLSRDEKGNLKASRVMQLWKMAQESGNEAFKEGMTIIQESYRPVRSKLYVRCQVKETGAEGEGMWEDVPLSLTDV